MGRENFTVPNEVSVKLSELAQAMGMNKTKLFEKLVNDEYDRRSELLKVYQQQIELEERAEALRK
jgi:hypothetical protein